MADNTEKLVTLSNLSDNAEEMKRILKQVRAYIDKKDDTKVDKESGKQLSTNDYTTTEKNKLAGIESGAQKNTVTGVKGNKESSYRTGNVNLTPANIGAAAASHTHAAADISDFTTKVKTLQAADILSAEPTGTTLTHTVNGTEVAYQIGELVRVPDSSSDTGYKFYQLHNITDGKATWAAVGTGSEGSNSDILISTIYIDQTITDPASMISGDINGAAIQAIRANSHRYLGKYTAENTMTICQLNDANSNQYADGSAAVLTGAEGDVFMRLPYFYTKATELTTDRWRIDFAFGGQPDGDRWRQWGGDDLIGVYKAYQANSKLYSRSGVTPSVSISQADFKTYARSRGTGFTIVKHKHQNIMAFLFYALYGHTNAQAQCGSGTSSYPKSAGGTNSLGMTDTTTSNGNSMSINFWGIENWWGDIYEWVDNVEINPVTANSIWRITEDDGSTRDVQGYSGVDIWVWPTKLIVGNYLDTIAKPASSNGGESLGYCDGQYNGRGIPCVPMRSNSSTNSSGGLLCINAYGKSSSKGLDSGSRLAFVGTITEAASVAAFKAATAIG